MKKVFALLLSLILCFNFIVPTQAIENEEVVTEDNIVMNYHYEMIRNMIQKIVEIIKKILTIENAHTATGNSMLEPRIKIIDNIQVNYLSCNKCIDDNLHKNVYYAPKGETIKRQIISIVLLDNDICKIEGFPQDITLKKWQWFITNKTNQEITVEFLRSSTDYWVTGYIPNFIDPYSTETEGIGTTFHYKGKDYPTVIDEYEFTIATGEWSKGVFTPDYIIYEPVIVNYEHLLF